MLRAGSDIAYWHRLTLNPETGTPRLSSRRLLVILDTADGDGPFKTAADRDGRWPDWKQMLAELTNEAYRMRSSFFAVNSEDGAARFDTTPLEFVDPVDERLRAEREAEKEKQAQQSQSDFESAMGFS